MVKSLSNDLTDKGFTVVALHPGWVQTEMGGANALISTSTSAAGLARVMQGLSAKDSGRFLSYDGTEIPGSSSGAASRLGADPEGGGSLQIREWAGRMLLISTSFISAAGLARVMQAA